MLTLVCWLYRSPTGHRHYSAKHVHRLIRMFRRNYTRPHRVLCITDQPEGIPCDVLPMPLELPNNYRRLWLFSKEAADAIPGRVFLLDLDVAITGNLDGYLDRPEPFVVMRDPMFGWHRYSSSYLMTTGSRTDIWEAFDPETSPDVMAEWYPRATGHEQVGSDQAWINYYLWDQRPPTFDQYRARLVGDTLPKEAKIVHFPGGLKPWTQEARDRYPWL